MPGFVYVVRKFVTVFENSATTIATTKPTVHEHEKSWGSTWYANLPFYNKFGYISNAQQHMPAQTIVYGKSTSVSIVGNAHLSWYKIVMLYRLYVLASNPNRGTVHQK